MDMVAVGAAQLAHQRFGRPSGRPPLLLLHGFTGSSVDWAGVAPLLAADREVLAYDHRGHGDSTTFGTDAAYTFAKLVEDLRGFLDALDVAAVDLVGHSMGGVVAQLFTLADPARVRSLVLMDTSPEPGRVGALVLRTAGAVIGRWGMEPVAALAERVVPPAAIPAEIALRQRQRQAMRRMDPVAFRAFARELATHPSLVGRLGEITCPTLVLVGERDRGLHRGTLALARGIPGARLVVIRGAMHSPQIENRDAWMAAVLAHLRHVSVKPS